MNRISQFFSKLFKREKPKAELKVEHFTVEAPKVDETKPRAARYIRERIRQETLRRKQKALTREKITVQANPKHVIKSWKPLPRFIEVGVNNRQSIEYRHRMRVPCSRHPELA